MVIHTRSMIGRSMGTASLLLACVLGSPCLGLADEKEVAAKADVTVESKDVGSKDAAAKDVVTPTDTKKTAKVEKAATKKTAAAAAMISPEREAAAVDFAQQNHPELVSLLQGLKKNAPKEYQAALADLDRAADRLTKLKDKAPERYEFQLSEWKITSRIRLLAAKLAMSDDPVVEGELRAALRERLEMRLAAQRTERDRLHKRVEKLDQTIAETSSKTDALIEKQFAELRSTLPVSKASGKNKTKRPVAADAVDVKGEK